jgi:cobalt-zinc-cadmium efflux system outer membrane protein
MIRKLARLYSSVPALARGKCLIKSEDITERIAFKEFPLAMHIGGMFPDKYRFAKNGGSKADKTLGASLSLNLPISRQLHPCELEAARATRIQAELQLKSVQLKVEVRVALERYQSSAHSLNVFRGGMLRDADRVLEARLYAYERGGATLLEVIDAQRKSAEVYLAYSQALLDHAHALVTLEETAAI